MIIWTNQNIEYDLKQKIHDFCHDNISIPGDQSHYRLYLKAAIVYTQFEVHNSIHNNSGLLKKERNGWMEISESTGTFHKKVLKKTRKC